jgi:hypothetical protein
MRSAVLLLLWSPLEQVSATGCGCLLISGAFAGGGRERYLELYNGCSDVVELSEYSLHICVDGCPARDSDLPGWNFSDAARLAPGQVFTLVDPASNQIFQRLAPSRRASFPPNASDPPLLSDGNDVYGLRSRATGALLDSLGDMHARANIATRGIALAGIDDALNGSLVSRKPSVRSSNCGEWPASAGTDEADSEWLVFQGADVGLAADLAGTHPRGGPAPPPYPPWPPLAGSCLLSCVFFSEYSFAAAPPAGGAQGGNDRYLEIFNGCARAVHADEFQLRICRDGCTDWEVSQTLKPSVLLPGMVYLVADYRAPPALVALADLLWLDFGDGNDAIGLWSRQSARILDQIGERETAAPPQGGGWAVAGLPNATVGYRLTRKPTVRHGNCASDWRASAGTGPADSEWLTSAIDPSQYASYDHAHEMLASPPPPSPSPPDENADTEPTQSASTASSSSARTRAGAAERPVTRGEVDVDLAALVIAVGVAVPSLVLLGLCCWAVPGCPLRERRKRRRGAARTAPSSSPHASSAQRGGGLEDGQAVEVRAACRARRTRPRARGAGAARARCAHCRLLSPLAVPCTNGHWPIIDRGLMDD